eukprot:GHRQ01022737.1.p2 GENE.GHRQ01022737.1~~GHRQ01022737.1.p2  ORF type:complete len:108 (+),score=42.58 GHRQ01022737.1:524-847(+)
MPASQQCLQAPEFSLLHHSVAVAGAASAADTCRYNLRVRLYRPRSASLLQTFTSWLTGMPAEFSDPKFPSYGEGREGEAAHTIAAADMQQTTQCCCVRWHHTSVYDG